MLRSYSAAPSSLVHFSPSCCSVFKQQIKNKEQPRAPSDVTFV